MTERRKQGSKETKKETSKRGGVRGVRQSLNGDLCGPSTVSI